MFYEVWGWFLRLNSKRGSNGFGVNPIQYSEICSFFELMQYTPSAWELELIERLDSVVLEVYAEQQEKKQREQEAKSKAKKK